ncbi:hypothetical protein E3P91_01208 [Wallemia ichthyophaga]|nr:hypothetical protein E3P91_01208 [Wallemia ichthyophaga]TIA83296.1 hypothetical protein E3P98_00916 [Wallemia ichthyophaga]TIB64994.1 hypothetical protein E3P78_00921 [Wallemia ichthyophaga]
MSDEEFEEGPDPFMVDLGEANTGNLNLLEESHRMESNQQTESANSLAFELAAAFGSGGSGGSPLKTQRRVVDEAHTSSEESSDDEQMYTLDETQLEKYNAELNKGIEINAQFLNKLVDIDSGLPMLESTATVVVKKLVETAKVRDDQSRQLWEMDRELSKEDDRVLAVLEPLKNEKIEGLDSIEEEVDEVGDSVNSNMNEKVVDTYNNHQSTSTLSNTDKSNSSIPSLEGFIDEYLLRSLGMITEISQISTATLNESSRKTRAMRSTLSGIKMEDKRTTKAIQVIERLESKSKTSLKDLMDKLQEDFITKMNKMTEWVSVQRVSQ